MSSTLNEAEFNEFHTRGHSREWSTPMDVHFIEFHIHIPQVPHLRRAAIYRRDSMSHSSTNSSLVEQIHTLQALGKMLGPERIGPHMPNCKCNAAKSQAKRIEWRRQSALPGGRQNVMIYGRSMQTNKNGWTFDAQE